MKLASMIKSKLSELVFTLAIVIIFVLPHFFLSLTPAIMTSLLSLIVFSLGTFLAADYFEDLDMDDDTARSLLLPVMLLTFLSCSITVGPALVLSWLGWI